MVKSIENEVKQNEDQILRGLLLNDIVVYICFPTQHVITAVIHANTPFTHTNSQVHTLTHTNQTFSNRPNQNKLVLKHP